MNKYILFGIIIYHSAAATAQKPGALIDVQHYEYNIGLNDADDMIKGKAVIELLLLQDTKTITLDLISKKADGKGMTVTRVTESGSSLVYAHNNNLLTINFAASAKKGDRKIFAINYEGIPADGLIITNNKFKHRGFFADNWPNRARNWIPCVDHPADKASVDFVVTAPVHYQVVSNGILVEENSPNATTKLTHYKETVPISTKIMVIGVADFAVQHAGDVQGIPVYSWVYPEDREKGFYDYAVATEILPFFIKNVGPYAFKKLANVESTTIFGGMENAGAIFYNEQGTITGQRRSESLLAHEIAHQWFGDMATESDWPHLWLSEGFATYMSILYSESKLGKDTARKTLVENRKKVIAFSKTQQRSVVDTTVTDYMELLNANSYEKGGWVLHMLRQLLGDSTFWKGIRTYYARYAGKNAVTDDLRKVLEEVSGTDLKQFFKQWLYTPGQPNLSITWKYDVVAKNTTVTVTQLQNTPFQFPLDLMLQTVGSNIPKTVQVKDKQHVFTISGTAKPQNVIADPYVRLLFEGSVKEVP